MLKEQTFFVFGMHCSLCEILIEKKLLKQRNIKSVEAKTSKGEVTIEFEDTLPAITKLNQMFEKEGYHFSDQPFDLPAKTNDWGFVAGAAGLIILIFLLLNRLGLSSLISVNAQSSLPIFFLFGLLAGVSSCAALVGGMVLSMAKQWGRSAHFLFNLGRIISFTALGGVLGGLGRLGGLGGGLSPIITSILVILVSFMMLFLGFQMLGLKFFQRFQFTLPKFITRYVADETNFQGRFMPALMGALTFFLPCGFTITTQGLALLSGSPVTGALMLLAFVLGTTPILLGIGFSSFKFSGNSHSAERFTKIAGILVLFFALFNLNSQLNVLGIKSLSDFSAKSSIKAVKESGKQVIKMNASTSGYEPNYFKVTAEVPVRWEITDTGTSGCTNAVIAKGLFQGQIPLTQGQVSIKEFTPEKPGKYKFSCWMGMISGVIEVVDK